MRSRGWVHMSKNDKKQLLSKLRFPEFLDSGEWENRPLADVLIEHGYKSNGSEEVFSVSVNKGLINQIEHLGRSFSADRGSRWRDVRFSEWRGGGGRWEV